MRAVLSTKQMFFFYHLRLSQSFSRSSRKSATRENFSPVFEMNFFMTKDSRFLAQLVVCPGVPMIYLIHISKIAKVSCWIWAWKLSILGSIVLNVLQPKLPACDASETSLRFEEEQPCKSESRNPKHEKSGKVGSQRAREWKNQFEYNCYINIKCLCKP